MTTTSTAPRVLRINQVIQAVGLSRSSIYRLGNLTPPLFPKPILIGITAVGWLAEDIDHFIIERKFAAMQIQ